MLSLCKLAISASLVLTATTAMAATVETPLADNLARLAEIEAMLLTDPIVQTDTDRAEASMYLAKNIAHYLRESVIYADTREPRLIYNPGFGFPNPDTHYITARIDAKGSYRLWGQLGNVNQTIFGVYSPTALEGNSGARARIRGEDLKLDKDGNFELFMSAKKMGGNWLPLADDVASMTIYQVFRDWNSERKGKLMIERLDTQDKPAANLTTASLTKTVNDLDDEMARFLKIWTDITKNYHGSIPDNIVTPPRRIQVTHLGSQFAPGHWNLKDDEAMIIEFDDPKARYWGFSFYQPWGELLDTVTRQTSLNDSQTHKDADGKYRIVVSAKDPGVANWIDISDHPHGVFNWRVTIDTPPATPVSQTVPVAELAKYLPANTTYVTAKERQAVIVERRRHSARRLSP
ncbi:MAG: DUF1214 domain-containing protein [Halioglobus sp.]